MQPHDKDTEKAEAAVKGLGAITDLLDGIVEFESLDPRFPMREAKDNDWTLVLGVRATAAAVSGFSYDLRFTDTADATPRTAHLVVDAGLDGADSIVAAAATSMLANT